MQGGSLRNKINNKIIEKDDYNEDQVEKWSNQLILGLNFLHNNEIIHRDIKPKSVFIIIINKV